MVMKAELPNHHTDQKSVRQTQKTTKAMANDIPVAISVYSVAVAPFSDRKKIS